MTDGAITELDATRQAALIAEGLMSAAEAVDAAIEKIEALNPSLNAVIFDRFEAAREEAKGHPVGEFWGVPILLKDLECAAVGEPDHRGSQVLARRSRRYTHDSAMVTRLREAGFIVLGRTNVPEFGLLGDTQNAAYGATKNPWNAGHSPGGSSGGSAAAVAAGMVPIAHGNDGGGSIRMPASHCGLVGLKPTRGRVSHSPGASDPQLGHNSSGVLTRSVRDTAAAIEIMGGTEYGDATIPPPAGDLRAAARAADPGRLRIGVTLGPIDDKWKLSPDCKDAVLMAAELLEQIGHQVEESSPTALFDDAYWPHWSDALSPGVKTAVDDALAGAHDSDLSDFSDVTMMWYERGSKMSAVDLQLAMDWLDSFRRRMGEWWRSGFDILLSPVALGPAPTSGFFASYPDGVRDSIGCLRFTPQFNTTGQPAISVPMSVTANNLPIGVQLVGPFGREDLLIGLAAQIEAARQWTLSPSITVPGKSSDPAPSR